MAGDGSEAFGINNLGQIVGTAETGTAIGVTHAFLYSGVYKQDLGTLGGTSSYAHGINESGQVVGAADVATGSPHAFIYSGGRMYDLGTLGDNYSIAYDINNASQVVGNSGITGDTDTHGFYTPKARCTILIPFAPQRA